MSLFSIIIPHWNGQHHLHTCLTSLRLQTVTDFEIIIADNGSTDGSQTYIKTEFPEVRLVEIGFNSGFTGACNAGYEIANGRFIILLNNDTEVDPHWLEQLQLAFTNHPQAAILASKLLLFDQRNKFHTAGDCYQSNGIPLNRGAWEEDLGQYDQEEQVFSACGAAAAYRRTFLEEVGFLDSDFFFSCEDVDIGWRAQLTGWDVWYIPTAIVYHKLKATGGSVTGSYYDGRNFFYLLWKNYPTPLLRLHWRAILNAQWTITKEALHHWRGEAARARLKGQLVGLLTGFIKMYPKRRALQQKRTTPIDTIQQRLSNPS